MEKKTVSVVLLTVAIAVGLSLAQAGTHTVNKHEKRDLLVRSKRRWVLSTIELVEEDPGPFPKLATKMFNDRIEELNDNHVFRITGTGVTEKPLGVFSIDGTTGEVMVHKAINREEIAFFHIKFDILDKQTLKPVDRTLAFDVAIKDINDNAPSFDPIEKATVKENLPQGYLPVPLKARDADEENTDNSDITLRVVSQEPAEPKIILTTVEGTKLTQLTFTGCFNYDKAKKYKVIVEAKDKGTPALSSSATVFIDVTDYNTHRPVFKENAYRGEIMEMETNKVILRIGVTDADTPNTPGWRAKYFFLKGNEEGNYAIETDPKTNEGILTVIKGKDYERTTIAGVEIGVENEEPLFECEAGAPGGLSAKVTPPNSVNITLKVIDVNDPPVFDKVVTKVYEREEEEPGKELYTPKITDEDSDVNKIRYEIVQDPAGWVSIDKKTGMVKTVKKMDRESPYVDKSSTYTVLVCAIDDGEPPATATSTLLIQLGDQNDNLPHLLNKSLVLCGNKASSINVPVQDADKEPYSGPFTFSLGGNDKTLKDTWKLDPSIGMTGGLVSLKSLAYGNYTVPLVIMDQQGTGGSETLEVVVCDCRSGDTCRGRLPSSSRLGPAAIGLLVAGLLLLLLLLCFCFLCECEKQSFKLIPTNLQDEGNQTLIKYNEEGGGSPCQAEPTLMLSQRNSVAVTDGHKQAAIPLTQMSQVSIQEMHEMNRSSGRHMMATQISSSGGFQSGTFERTAVATGTMRSQWGHGTNSSRMYSSIKSNSARYSHSLNRRGVQMVSAENIDKRLHMIGDDYPAYLPRQYIYEGQGSMCTSLDELSLSNLGDDLEFVGNLGPKFNTLGGICQQGMQGTESNL
ncbi:cadherin-like protein 26 isoform X2 [Hypomesus transpacificus]|uniref:cadherin-like protein 26 isoform X2 n=1 Tax=Hypomesus transpacificus TaxID=137520 RepID=UPI001F082236|nr:cadherin-like protein 26 isoform X2 [Hypomesus transpacificus]